MRTLAFVALSGACLALASGLLPASPVRRGPIPPDQVVRLRITDPRPQEAVPMVLENGVGRGTCEATIIDTRTFAQQIQEPDPGVVAVRKGMMLTPHRTPESNVIGPANDLVAIEDESASRTNIQSLFTGITNTGWNPPDCTVAAGPDHVVCTVNSSIAFFTKSGTKQFQVPLDNTGAPGFFEPQGASNFVFDPKVIYDPRTGRFIVVVLEEYDASQTSYVDIAISDDSDPNGVWYKYRTSSVVTIGTTKYWVDYPGVGVDDTGIYVTGNLFGFASGFAGGWVRCIEKSSVLSGGTAAYADLNLTSGSSYQVADAWPDSRCVLVHRNSSTLLALTAINNPFTAPAAVVKTVAVPSTATPPDAGAKGTTALLDTIDTRIMNAVIRNGSLYTCHTVSGSTRALARWYQINLNGWPATSTASPALTMSGNIAAASTTESSFFPAINVNARGDVAVVHAASSTAIFPEVRVATRRATDPTGTLGAPVTLATSASSPSGTGVQRWGDYFACCVDPINDCTFWGIGENRSASAWTTAINSFTVAPSTDVDGDGSVNGGDISLLLLSFGDCACCPEDVDESGSVDAGDVSLILLDF
jgi:hypothetical protein